MGLHAIELDRQRVVDFFRECCDDTFIGDMLKEGSKIRVSSIEAHVSVPVMDDFFHHEIEVTVLFDVKR